MTTDGPWRLFSRRALGVMIAALGSGLVAAGAGAAPAPAGSSTVATVWTEPEAGYGFLIAAIHDSRHSIDMSMYELNDRSTEVALVGRAHAGVDVRVVLDSDYSGKRENAAAAALLTAGGVHVTWAPAGQIFHAKYLVIDSHVAYIGTGNLVATDYPTTRDFWVADTTARDVAAITSTFATDFSGNPGTGVASNGLVWSPGSTTRLVELIDAARTSLLVENEEMDSSVIEQSLESAATRGVDVEVVMTEDPSWTTALNELTKAGDHVRVLASNQVYIHAKVICADCSTRAGSVFIGSENFSTSSLSRNRELGVITTSLPAIQAVRRAVAVDFAGGRAVAAPTAPASTTPAPTSHGTSGVTITSFEPTIATGAEDSLSVHSNVAGDTCALSVQLPSGYASASKGLGTATADQSGNVTWRWEIGPSTKGGNATASITCRAGSVERSFAIT
jgi:cardiolipin synthase A/B